MTRAREELVGVPGEPDLRSLRFVVCVGGGEESVETLRFAIRIVKALGGDLTVLYVARPIPGAVRDEVRLLQEKLGQWSLDLPGVAFLRYARDLLREAGVLPPEAETMPGAPPESGTFHAVLPAAHGGVVRFRIREGDIAEEIRRETRSHPADLLIIGAGDNRRLQHKVVQFNDVSTLFLKNVRPGAYRFLVCTGGEPAGVALAEFTARVARALRMEVTVLSVDDLRQSREEAERAVARLAAVFAEREVPVRTHVRKGALVRTIVEAAGEDHVIVIGRSHEPEIKKFLFGSRPIRVIQDARCPVLHVVDTPPPRRRRLGPESH